MILHFMKSKIHRATVTEANLSYEGSISICPDLIKKAGFHINEKVAVYNCNNGSRFSTYIISGKKGQICLNGAAARHAQVGDLVILCTYCLIDESEISGHKPKVVFVDHKNRPTKTKRQERHSTKS